MDRRALLIALAAAPACGAFARSREPIVGLPCEGCEAVFQGQPTRLTSHGRIAPPGEPGIPLILSGRIVDRGGRARSGVVVYAYQTDHTGLYRPGPGLSGESVRHGRLRGWAASAPGGSYRFDTIRPAAYPGRDVPEHIHMHVIEPGRATYYIDDVMFEDDTKLTKTQRAMLVKGRGGAGVCSPLMRNGVWRATRDIVLGANIPGYPA